VTCSDANQAPAASTTTPSGSILLGTEQYGICSLPRLDNEASGRQRGRKPRQA